MKNIICCELLFLSLKTGFRDFYEKRNYNPKKGHTFHSENITCLGKNN